MVLRIVGRVYFANAQQVGESIRKLLEVNPPRVLILDCNAIPDFEYTALMALVEFEADLRKQGMQLVLAALNPSALDAVRHTTLGDTLGRSGMFSSVQAAVDQCAKL
jgi:MFS superfamily sulfate permease-like transporter